MKDDLLFKNEIINICKNNEKIPLKYRKDKNEAKLLIQYIIDNKIEIENSDIYVLASWVNIDLYNFKTEEKFVRIENIEYVGEQPTFDFSVKNKHSYVANGLICHNTINLPENVEEKVVAEIYETAWENGLKGITVYRDKCRSGVLVNTSVDDERSAPKRPKELPCEIYHVNITKKLDKVRHFKYIVAIGMLNGYPYEVFAIENTFDKKFMKFNECKVNKIKRGHYDLVFDDDNIIENITKDTTENEDSLTRMISTSLRHNIPINFICDQLNKVEGEMFCFAKSIARSLKKFIKDGSKSGHDCPECGSKFIFENGCYMCKNCGNSKCN